MKGIRLLKVSQRKRSQDRLLEINPLISTMTITIITIIQISP